MCSICQYHAKTLRIKRAFCSVLSACHFLYAEYPHIAALDHIIVGGEGAQRSHVLSWLQQQCDRPVYSANPFVHMRAAAGCDLQQLHYDAPLYLTACGLAKRVC